MFSGNPLLYRRDEIQKALKTLFTVRAEAVFQWLTFLKMHNPQYFNIAIDFVPQDACNSLIEELLADKSITDPKDGSKSAVVGNIAERIAKSNIAEDEETRMVDLVDYSACIDRVYPVFTSADQPEEQNGVRDDVVQAMARGLQKVMVGEEPINEYTHLPELLLGGFPTVVIRAPTTIYDYEIEIALKRKSSLLAQSKPALFALYDMRRRHEVARATAKALKGSEKSLANVQKLLDDPDFDRLLDCAIKHNQGQEAKRLERCVLPFLTTVCKGLNFSPGKRRQSLRDLFALERRFGQADWWITINPADNDQLLTVRIGCNSLDTNELVLQPPGMQERMKVVSENPALAAQVFDLIIKSTLEHLFGIPEPGKKSPTSLRPGILGMMRAYYGVVECQCRGSLHYHCLLWSAVGARRFSEVAEDPQKNAEFGAAIDKLVCEKIDLQLFGSVLSDKVRLGKRYKALFRPSLASPPPVVASPEFSVFAGKCAAEVHTSRTVFLVSKRKTFHAGLQRGAICVTRRRCTALSLMRRRSVLCGNRKFHHLTRSRNRRFLPMMIVPVCSCLRTSRTQHQKQLGAS